MPRTRKTHSPNLKAKVAIEALKGHRPISEIAQMFHIHPNLVNKWKKQALDLLPELFQPQSGLVAPVVDQEKEELFRQIGRMKVELDFLKKTAGLLR